MTLRAWGAKDNLNVQGMFHTKVTTKRSATCRSWVYMVAGHRPEPLLGVKDAERLGIITFRLEGREPTREKRSSRVGRLSSAKGHHDAGTPRPKKTATIPSKLKKGGCHCPDGQGRAAQD